MRTVKGMILFVLLGAAGMALLPGTASAGQKTVWLCKPGLADNPCEPGLKTTIADPSGQPIGTEAVKADRKRRIDCFYVYPTVSDDPGVNSDLQIDPEERSIALYQAARYSQHCRVFAPMYRQITLTQLLSGQPITQEEADLGYGDVVRAWKTYLKKYNKGRGIVFLSHSQGSAVLRRLVSEKVDRKPKVRKRMLSALLLGGDVLVPKGKTSKKKRKKAGDFRNIVPCESNRQLGCVVGFSAYNEPVPNVSLFGRPGSSDLFGGDPETEKVLCANPAALGGGTRKVTSVYPGEPFAPGTTIGLATSAVGNPQPVVDTPWVEYRGAYKAGCSSADNANVLQITGLPGSPELHAVPDASWGLHLVDANIALGNLVSLVGKESKAYAKKLKKQKKKKKKRKKAKKKANRK